MNNENKDAEYWCHMPHQRDQPSIASSHVQNQLIHKQFQYYMFKLIFSSTHQVEKSIIHIQLLKC